MPARDAVPTVWQRLGVSQGVFFPNIDLHLPAWRHYQLSPLEGYEASLWSWITNYLSTMDESSSRARSYSFLSNRLQVREHASPEATYSEAVLEQVGRDEIMGTN